MKTMEQENQQQERSKKEGLKTTTIALMVVVAFFYDVIQILLSWIGIGLLIIPIFYLHYWMWFNMHGVKFFTMKKAKYAGIGLLLETITAGILPAFTLLVLRIALDSKIRDTLDKLPVIESVGQQLSRTSSTPKNKAA